MSAGWLADWARPPDLEPSLTIPGRTGQGRNRHRRGQGRRSIHPASVAAYNQARVVVVVIVVQPAAMETLLQYDVKLDHYLGAKRYRKLIGRNLPHIPPYQIEG